MARSQRRDDGVAAWWALLRAHAAVVRRLEQHLGIPKGLPLSWYDVLLELGATPDRRLRMQELGERAVLFEPHTGSALVVDTLVAEGLRRTPARTRPNRAGRDLTRS